MRQDITRQLLILALIVFAALAGAFVYAKLARYTQAISVDDLYWERYLYVETLQALAQDSKAEHIPGDAYNIRHYTKERRISKTCVGTAQNSKRTPEALTYDCSYDSEEAWAFYTVNRWVRTADLRKRGTIRDERVWPDFTPNDIRELGSTREAERGEILTVRFKGGDLPLDYRANDVADWRRFVVGQAFTVDLNRLNEPIWESLVEADRR